MKRGNVKNYVAILVPLKEKKFRPNAEWARAEFMKFASNAMQLCALIKHLNGNKKTASNCITPFFFLASEKFDVWWINYEILVRVCELNASKNVDSKESITIGLYEILFHFHPFQKNIEISQKLDNSAIRRKQIKKKWIKS